MASGNWCSTKYIMLFWPISSEARAVLAEPGPMSKTVQADITETAVSLLTPRPTRIGKMDATSNRPSPVALGVQIKSIWPMGMTIEAARYGNLRKNDSGCMET